MSEKNPLQSCPQCKGSGKIRLTEIRETKPARITELPCISCDGTGLADDAVFEEIRFYASCWCQCSDDGKNRSSATFHGDEVTPWEWCVQKHHYHCTRCQKLVQIG